MKITGVKVTPFIRRLARRMGDASMPAGTLHAVGCVIELNADEQLTGVAIGREDPASQIARITEEVLVGEDPRGVTGLWQLMMDARFKGGHGGIVSEAIALLDVALWDLKAKANHEPLWKALGGSRPRVIAHASGWELPLQDSEVFEWYHTMARDFGFRSGKLKVGLDQQADIRRLGLMKEALLTSVAEPTLMIDADECWSPKQAIRNVRELEEQFDLTWVEEPARRWDFLGLKRISNGIRAAVCSGENLRTLGEFLPHLHHHALDVVQVGADTCGITGALQVADAAYGFELPVALTRSPGNIHAHLAGAMPYCMSLEVVDPLPEQGVFSSDVRIEGGWAIAGDRPGNGLVIDHDALERASLEQIPPEIARERHRVPFGGVYDVANTAAERRVAEARRVMK